MFNAVSTAPAQASDPPAECRIRTEYLLLVAIVMAPSQARTTFDPAKLQALGESLKARQFHPITVCSHPDIPGKYLLIDGERRVRAAMLAMLRGLEARVLQRAMTKLEFLEYQLAEDGLKEKLKPTETCAAIADWLMLTGKTQVEAGRKFGYTQGMVSRVLKLVDNVAKELQPKIDHELTMSHWLELGRLTQVPVQIRAHRMAKELAWSRDALKGWIDVQLGRAKPKAGAKLVTLKLDGREIAVKYKPGDDHDQAIEMYQTCIAKHQKAKREGIALADIRVLFGK